MNTHYKSLIVGLRYRCTTKANDIFEGTFSLQSPRGIEGHYLIQLTKKPEWASADFIELLARTVKSIEVIE